MTAVVQLSGSAWLDRRRNVPAYGRRLGAVLDAAAGYADALAEEVAAQTGRSPRRGRTLMWLGHALGWGGLALSLYGLIGLRRPELRDLVLGPFGIGLLMQLPSGALVRAGRRDLRPEPSEAPEIDKRRPVVLLGSMRDHDGNDVQKSRISPALAAYGPVVDAARLARERAAFGEVDAHGEIVRLMDGAVLVVLMPSAAGAEAFEMDAIARRRLAHKLLVLLPPLTAADTAVDRWGRVRAALSGLPGFAGLPDSPPVGVVGAHLTASGEPVLITGPISARTEDYARAIDVAIYGMKCHEKW